MVKHTPTIRRQQPTNCLSAFDHFVGLAVKELIMSQMWVSNFIECIMKPPPGEVLFRTESRRKQKPVTGLGSKKRSEKTLLFHRYYSNYLLELKEEECIYKFMYSNKSFSEVLEWQNSKEAWK